MSVAAPGSAPASIAMRICHALALQPGGLRLTADQRHLQQAAVAGAICHLKDWTA